MSPNSYERAAELLGLAFVTLGEISSDVRTAESGLAALGWAPPPGVDLTTLALDTSDLSAKLEIVLESTPDERVDDAVMAGRYADLALAVVTFARQIDTFAAELPGKLAAAGEYATKTDIATQLPRRLLDYVVVRGIQSQSPALASILHMAGVFGVQHFPQDDATYQLDHERVVIDPDQLPLLVSNPGQAFTNVYGWGTAAFDAESLLNNAGLVLTELGGRSSATLPRETTRARRRSCSSTCCT